MFNTKHGNKWELIDVRNFDNELLDNLKEAAKKISDEFSESFSKSKSKTITVWDLAMQVEQRFKQEFHTIDNLGDEIHNFYSNEERRIEVYTNITIEVLRANHKAFDEFLLRKVISTAISSTDKGKEVLRKKMVKTFCMFV